MKYVVLSRGFRVNLEAHAFHRKEALARISGYKKTLRSHLVKLITRQENTTDTNHWIIEIQDYLDAMCDFSLKQESSLTPIVVYEAIVGKGNIDLEQSIKNILNKMLSQGYSINQKYKKKTNLKEEADKLFQFYGLASQAISDHFSKGTKVNAKQLLEQSNII